MELKEEKSFTDEYIKFIPGYLEVPIALVLKEGAKERNLVINLLEKLKNFKIELDSRIRIAKIYNKEFQNHKYVKTQKCFSLYC